MPVYFFYFIGVNAFYIRDNYKAHQKVKTSQGKNQKVSKLYARIQTQAQEKHNRHECRKKHMRDSFDKDLFKEHFHRQSRSFSGVFRGIFRPRTCILRPLSF